MDVAVVCHMQGGDAAPVVTIDPKDAKIAQLEQQLAAMASSQVRPTSGDGASTSYGPSTSHGPSTSYGADGDLATMGFMCGTAHIDASAALTRGAAKALEPRGAVVELDPQRGDAHRQTKLPQSFTLSETVTTASMNPVRTNPIVGKLVESGNDSAGLTSTLLGAATAVVRAPLFSATDMLNLGVGPA